MNRYRARSNARIVIICICGLAATATLDAQDWSSWRGPAADGMARGDAPVTWNGSDGVAWKVDIPGRGHSSPVVWGNQIFVTTAVPTGSASAETQESPDAGARFRGGQGTRRGVRSPHGDSGPQGLHRFVLLSLDKTTGDVLWERTATEATPHEGFHPQYGSFASHSPVTDGDHVIAYFGSRGLYCYDLDGNLVWKTDLGEFTKFLGFGEGTPPVLHDDRVIIKADHEGDSFIVALDMATGDELWRAARDEGTSWSSPLVVDHDGRRQVVVAATGKVRGYDFETGDVIWEVAGLGRNQIPAPVHQDGLVLVMSGFISPNLMAVRLGERGDLTGSDAVVWTHRRSLSYTASPVLHENQLYVLTDNGILTSFDAATGEIHYRERLPGPSNFKASPIGADGRLYLASEEGQVFVVRMGPTFELLATNMLDDASFVATPAIVDGEILLRSRTSLYRVGGAN
jgi:outer membrane protein assembly factor BamB